jgi:ABC-type lipoprotein export system ATPase subunit
MEVATMSSDELFAGTLGGPEGSVGDGMAVAGRIGDRTTVPSRIGDETAGGTGAATAPTILCRDLVRIYTAEGIEVQALQGVDLQVRSGELIAVIGVSGSGKSTLLSILAGLDRATAGTAIVAGHDLLRMDRAERVRYQRDVVGFVWQQAARNLLPYLTAAENVAMVLSLAGRRRTGVQGRRARIASLLELLGIGYCADRRPPELSGGEQQRVAIAVALANSPEVLLADEPTGELDETSTGQVLDALRGVNAELGVTTLIVTHDPAVAGHVRRTIHIRDGRIATETMRRTEVDEQGRERRIAEEFAVVDRLGRMQIPQQAALNLRLMDRVRLSEQDDHLAVWPQGAGWEESS